MFYIESRYIDIKTLIDLPDYKDGDNNPLPQKTDDAKVEILEVFEVKDEKDVGQKSPPNKNTEPPAQLFSIIIPQSLKADSANKPIDKTNFYIKYISDKFGEKMSADLIRILLNPYNTNLVYRYDLQDSERSIPTMSRQLKESGENKKSLTADEDGEKSQVTKQNDRELSQKRKLDNKLEEELRLQKRQLLEKRIINNVRG